MPFNTLAADPIDLKTAIAPDPLIVAPETSLSEAIALMSSARVACPLPTNGDPGIDPILGEVRSSCLLAVQDHQLIGILTERDVVRLSAQEQPIATRTIAEVMTHPVMTLRQSELSDLFAALNPMQKYRIRHLPITTDAGEVIGVLTHESLCQLLRPIDLLNLRLVSEVMVTQVIQAFPNTPVLTIAQQMTQHQVSAVVIVEPSPTLAGAVIPLGIITERDIVQFKALGLDFLKISAQEVMSAPVFVVEPQDSLWTVRTLMQERRVHRIGVVGQQGELRGIVTQSSLLQILNPVEMYRLVETLKGRLSQLEAERLALLQNRTIELEQQVQERTTEITLRAEREQLLSAIATRIRSSLNKPATLNAIVNEVRNFLHCDRVLVYQFNSQDGGIVTAEAVLPGWRNALGDLIVDPCFERTIQFNDLQSQKRAIADIQKAGYSPCYVELLTYYQVKANLVVPILVEDRIWGLLIAHQCQSTRVWEPDELELLDRIAVHIGIAIQQAQAYERSCAELAEKQRTEAALRQSEHRYASLAEAAPVGIFRADVDGNCLYVNERWCQITGIPSAEATGIGWARRLHPEDRDKVATEWYASAREARSFQLEYRFARHDGLITWVFGQSVAERGEDGEIIGYVGTITDITARKRAEAALHQLNQALETKIQERTAALRESEERWQLALQGTNDGIWDWNVKTNTVFFSTRWKQMRGFSETEIGNCLEEWSSRLHPDDCDRVHQAIATHFTGQTPFFEQEYRVQRKDGSYMWVLDRGKALWDETGQVVRMTGSETDITRRKQAEAGLMALTSLQQAILNSSHYSMISCTTEGTIQTFNVAAQKMLGYTAEEVIGKATPLLIHDPQEIQQQAEMLSLELGRTISPGFEVFVTKASAGTPWEQEWTYIRKDGSRLPVLLSVTALRDPQGQITGFLGIAKDITQRKQAEEQLRQTLKELSDFKYALDQGSIVAITTAQGVITYVNDRFCEICGYSRTELIGKTPRIIKSDQHDREFFVNLWSTITQGRVWRSEIQNRAKNGTTYWLDETIVPFVNEEGKPIQYVAISTDITDRKKAESALIESEERYRQIVETAGEGIWILDLNNNTTFVNHRMAQMLKTTPEEMLGHSLFDFMDEEGRQIAERNLERRRQGVREQHDFKFKRRDGSDLWTIIETTPFIDDRGCYRGALGMLTDISDRKQAEAQIRKSNEQLSRANTELEKATRMKDEFLANMSHELRTPLNAVLGMCEGLQEAVFGPINQRQQKAISTIERSGRHLLELINDILDLSKIEAGKLELQWLPVSVQSLCDASLLFVRQQAIQKNIQLSTVVPENLSPLIADERRMRQVLINLLNNAVKFTPEQGSVRLEVSQETDIQGRIFCRFSVMDTGIGISPENANKLFQPFTQIDSSLNRQHSGTGLGLVLVRRIVELHGGTVSLSSEVNRGSCFTVKVPNACKESLSVSPQPPLAAEGGLSAENTQVLIIEDSMTAAHQVARYLRELEMQPVIYSKGEGAIAQVIHLQPALVILDIQLPDLSGWEVLKQLKADSRTSSIPVMITSVVDERSQGLQLGAVAYLVKPITRQQLHTTIQQICQVSVSTITSPTIPAETRPATPLILLAEDNEANLDTFIDYLTGRGYRIICAKNGQEAIDLAKSDHPDLILMDIQMPGVDGLVATRQIRSDPELAQIPIIALTALAMTGDREKCLAAGANEYLTKPVRLKELASTIQQLLKPS